MTRVCPSVNLQLKGEQEGKQNLEAFLLLHSFNILCTMVNIHFGQREIFSPSRLLMQCAFDIMELKPFSSDELMMKVA